MTNKEIILIIAAIMTIILGVITIYKHFFDIKIKKNELKEKEQDKLNVLEPKLLVQIISKTISPTAAKLCIEIENKSNFDIYNITFNPSVFIKDDFFKVPPIFSNTNQNGVELNQSINRLIKEITETTKMYNFIENNNNTEALYAKQKIISSLYLLNTYKEMLENDYLDTIKYFDSSYILKKIENKTELTEFLNLLQHMSWSLTGISYNLNLYIKKIENDIHKIEKLKQGDSITIPIIDFQFFIFDDDYKKKTEVKFSSKEKLDIEFKFDIHNKNIVEEKEIEIKNIRVNNALTKLDVKDIQNSLNELYNSIYFKDWEAKLSKEHLEKFKSIRFQARNDITVFMRYNNTKQLHIDFYVEYKHFIKLLDDKFKTTQTVFAI